MAVVRSESSASLVKVVQALAEGGVTAAEITFTVPDALEVIHQVRRVVGDAIATGDFTRMRELPCQYAAIVARVRETR